MTAVLGRGAENAGLNFLPAVEEGLEQDHLLRDGRELLDHVVVLSERRLRRILQEYVDYYNTERVHTALSDEPASRAIEAKPSDCATVVGLPRVGGLHHRYVWREAA